MTLLGRFSPSLILGSSTALLALLAALATLSPEAQLVFYFIPMTAKQLIGMVALLEVLLAVAGMLMPGEAAGHLAAMGAGYLLIHHRIVSRDWSRAWRDWSDRRHAARHRLQIVDLDKQVDHILDKVLVKGAASLSREEQELMQRYSKSKR